MIGSGVAILLLSVGLFNHPAGSPYAEAKRYLDAKDYSKALPPLQKAAAAGNAEAMNQLGELHYYGRGVVQDYAQARQWYQKAADAGNPDAKGALARLSSISSPAPVSSPLPVSQASPSPTSPGSESLAEAKRYLDKQDYAKARPLLERAADAGSAQAINELGILYEHGWGVPQDYAQARRWYQTAAYAGSVIARGQLDDLNRRHRSVTQGYFEASEEATAAGHADTSSAWYAQARQFYEKAAATGSAAAMNNLGRLYENGLGVAQDYAQAREWYQKAADAGNADAKQALLRLRSK